jgi:ribosomal protein S5
MPEVAYFEGHLDAGKTLVVDYHEDGTAVVDSEAIRELLELSGCKELWTHAPRS